MFDFILTAILWVLALYGLIEIIKNIIYICTYTNLTPNGIYLIVAVKNGEEKIEGFLRTILFRILYGKEESIKNVIVTDLGSSDKSLEIINKLQKDYEYIKVNDWKECKQLLDDVEKITN